MRMRRCFKFLNTGISKCFYWNLDQGCKIWLKNSNPFWRYKQNTDRISTKWNAHPLLARIALITSQSRSMDTLPTEISNMKIMETKKTREFMKRTAIVLISTFSDIYTLFYFTSYLSCYHIFTYSKHLTKMFLILLPPASLLLISYPASISGTAFCLISQKLCRIKHEWITAGSSLRFMSISLLKQPNVHSITILAEDKRCPKKRSLEFFPTFVKIPSSKMVVKDKLDPQGYIPVLQAPPRQ